MTQQPNGFVIVVEKCSDGALGRDKANSIFVSESCSFNAPACHFAASFQRMVSVWSVLADRANYQYNIP
jgi:hypothetical protein